MHTKPERRRVVKSLYKIVEQLLQVDNQAEQAQYNLGVWEGYNLVKAVASSKASYSYLLADLPPSPYAKGVQDFLHQFNQKLQGVETPTIEPTPYSKLVSYCQLLERDLKEIQSLVSGLICRCQCGHIKSPYLCDYCHDDSGRGLSLDSRKS